MVIVRSRHDEEQYGYHFDCSIYLKYFYERSNTNNHENSIKLHKREHKHLKPDNLTI